MLQSSTKKSWIKTVLLGAYHMFMIILLVTNTVFLIFHWSDLRIELSETSLILTIVGFFFAFAGINIYSIFNTNVETEKEQLKDLSDKYQKEIMDTMCLLYYSKKLISYYHYAQIIVNSKKFNSQSFEQISSVNSIIGEYKSFLASLYKRNEYKLYDEYKRDFLDVSRGIKELLNVSGRDKKFPKNFFQELKNPELERLYREQFKQLVEMMAELETYDYTGVESLEQTNDKNFKERWNIFASSFMDLIKG